MRQTPDGHYLMAGDGDFELIGGGVQIVPWLAEVDGKGDLLWQRLYYEIYPPTGRPLSEYFASAAVTGRSGAMAVGYTEDYEAQRGELYAVMTDRSGDVQGCGDEHPPPPLDGLDPALVPIGSSLSLGEADVSATSAPVTTVATSASTQHECP
jgi:hypothetical protein